MSKPKLALFVPNLDGGGAERMMVNLAGGFAKRGFKVDLVLATARGRYLDLVPETVNVTDLEAKGVTASLPKLVHYLRQHRPYSLLTTLEHASVVALWARRLSMVQTRVVVRLSNMLFLAPSVCFKTKALRRAVKLFYPWADSFIAGSEGVAVNVQQFTRVPEAKVHTIYNPVVTDDLRLRARELPEHPWFTSGAPPVVLGVGRLEGQKDFVTLVRAFAQVRRTRPVRLVILGEGGKRPELEALVAQLGLGEDVLLPGFVDNPFAYMAHADTFVLSSRYEGLPGVLIQAMACGCKIVSTDCPSGPREILRDGSLGRLVPVGDVTALAGAISETLVQEKTYQSRELRERAADFSEEKTVPQYLKVLLAR